MLKSKILNKIQKIINEKYHFDIPFILDIPNNNFGDYATNFAFQIAKSLKKSPKLIAEELIQLFNQETDLQEIFTCSTTNGFINFRLNDNFLFNEFIDFLIKKPQFPKIDKTTILEFVSANPTGPLHIGHGRWAVLGDVMARIARYLGQSINTEFYINDSGNQIINFNKTIEAIRNNQPIPDDGYHGQYMYNLAKETEPLKAVVKHQKQVLSDLDVNFDNWFSESNLYQDGTIIEVLTLLKQAELTYEKDNALWFNSSKFGDEKDRVLIKKDQAYTYFLVDIAYHLTKVKRGYNRIINIWGADHHGYIQRLKSAVLAITEGNIKPEDFQVILGQLVNLYRNSEPLKMSKRTGEMITLEEVLEEIGKDALRFFLIQKNADLHLDFDLELAKKKSSENPVFYLQYSYARICSVLVKLEKTDLDVKKFIEVKLDEYERNLIFKALQVYDEIYFSGVNFSPYKLTIYALELAKTFHLFYENCSILKAIENEKNKRIFILLQVKQVFGIIFDLLGITKLDRM